MINTSLGEYPGVIMTIVLRRKINYHLLQVIIMLLLAIFILLISIFRPLSLFTSRFEFSSVKCISFQVFPRKVEFLIVVCPILVKIMMHRPHLESNWEKQITHETRRIEVSTVFSFFLHIVYARPHIRHVFIVASIHHNVAFCKLPSHKYYMHQI